KPPPLARTVAPRCSMDPSPAPVGLVSPNYFGATSLLFGSACTPSGLRTHLWTSFELDGCAGNVAQSPLGNGATSRNGLRLALKGDVGGSEGGAALRVLGGRRCAGDPVPLLR